MLRAYRRFMTGCVWNLEKVILWLGGDHGLSLANHDWFRLPMDWVFERCWRYHCRHRTAWWRFMQLAAEEQGRG